MMRIKINDNCDLCNECIDICVNDVLSDELLKGFYYDSFYSYLTDDCTYCESCVACCPENAITIINNDIEGYTYEEK